MAVLLLRVWPLKGHTTEYTHCLIPSQSILTLSDPWLVNTHTLWSQASQYSRSLIPDQSILTLSDPRPVNTHTLWPQASQYSLSHSLTPGQSILTLSDPRPVNTHSHTLWPPASQYSHSPTPGRSILTLSDPRPVNTHTLRPQASQYSHSPTPGPSILTLSDPRPGLSFCPRGRPPMDLPLPRLNRVDLNQGHWKQQQRLWARPKTDSNTPWHESKGRHSFRTSVARWVVNCVGVFVLLPFLHRMPGSLLSFHLQWCPWSMDRTTFVRDNPLWKTGSCQAYPFMKHHRGERQSPF